MLPISTDQLQIPINHVAKCGRRTSTEVVGTFVYLLLRASQPRAQQAAVSISLSQKVLCYASPLVS